MKFVIAAAALVFSAPASAEVVRSGNNGFSLRYQVTLPVAPAAALAAFAQLPRWWNPDHTYSGSSANLAMRLEPGGCFCERLPDGGGIEHMRVVYVDPDKRAVLTGSLGPLLYLATTAVMDVQVEPSEQGSKVTIDYRAAGFADGGAEKLAPLVDSVIGEQVKRYAAFAASSASR